MFTINNSYQYGQCSYDRTEWINVWLLACYHTLPLCEVKTIPVYNRDGKVVESFDLAGPTVYSKNPKMYKFLGDVPESYQTLEHEIIRNLKMVGLNRMFPSHSNWIENSTDFAEYRILTADDAYDLVTLNENFARGQLFYHLKPGKSRFLGRFVCHVVVDGSLELHDGFSYARKSAFPMVPGILWKGIGYKNLKGFIANQEMVAKGMIKLISDAEFDRLIAEYDCDSDVQVIVPKFTCKFHAGEEKVELDFYSLFKGNDKLSARYSLKMFKTLPLTAKGLDLGYTVFSQEIDAIFEALKTQDRGALLSLMGKAYAEYVDTIDEVEGFNVELAEMTSTMNCLLDLPMGDEEVIGKVLHILFKNLKKVKASGMTGIACPGNGLNPFEIRVPSLFLKKYGKHVGDTVTLYRAPFTGLEAATVTIVGTTEEGIEIDSIFWANRFSGDFDGDLAGILVEADLIDETKIGFAVSSKKKGKKAQTVAMATSKAWYSKLSISKMDSVITACLEKGIDPAPARELMQAIIDMVKHEVELPEDMDAFILMLLGSKLQLNTIHGILNLQRTAERLRQSTYNLKVELMQQESSNIPLLKSLIPHFSYVLCKTKYTAPDRNGELHKIHAHYNRICVKQGFPGLAVPRDFNAPSFDSKVVAKNLPLAVKTTKLLAAKPKVVMVADTISNDYDAMVKHFRKGDITGGYAVVKKLVDKMNRSDHALMGEAIKYLFMSIVHKNAKLHKGTVDYGWYLKVMAYLPREIGSWNLRRASRFYGGTPAMQIAVVSNKK
jgi:hypothetical protein